MQALYKICKSMEISISFCPSIEWIDNHTTYMHYNEISRRVDKNLTMWNLWSRWKKTPINLDKIKKKLLIIWCKYKEVRKKNAERRYKIIWKYCEKEKIGRENMYWLIIKRRAKGHWWDRVNYNRKRKKTLINWFLLT